MRLKGCLYSLILLTAFLFNSIYAQEIKEVKIDLGSGNFLEKVPFDSEFFISSNVDKKIQKVKVRWFDEKFLKPLPLGFAPKEGNFRNGESIWNRTTGDDKNFKLKVGPLNPYLNYKFEFTFYSSDDNKNLEKKISSAVVKSLKNNDFNFGHTKRDLFDWYELVKNNIKCENKISLNNDTFESFWKVIEKKVKDAKDLNDQIKENERKFEHNFYYSSKTFFDRFKQKINSLATQGHIQLSSATFDHIWSKTLQSNLLLYHLITNDNKEISKTKSLSILDHQPASFIEQYTLFEIAQLIDTLFRVNNSKGFIDVIKRKASFDRNGINENPNVNYREFRLLLEFFGRIIDDDFLDAINESFFSGSDKNNIISRIINPINNLYELRLKQENQLTTIANEVRKIFKHKALVYNHPKKTFAIENVIPDVSPKRYLNFEIGYGKIISERNYQFLYPSFHLYFSPVNEDLPLSKYKGVDGAFLKRFSLFAGVTITNLSSDDEIDDAFNGGNPVVGIGYRGIVPINSLRPRFFDNLRVGTGVIFYKIKDKNPLIDKKRRVRDFFWNITFDLDVAEVIGPVLKVLGIEI